MKLNLKTRPRYEDFREVEDKQPEGRKFKDFEYAWHHRGVFPDGTRVEKVKDALAMWEAPVFIPRIVNNIVMEPVEPNLIGLQLLQRLKFEPGTQVIDAMVIGATGDDYDVGEGESYPEFRVSIGPGAEHSQMGKSGLQLKFTEEALRYASYDVVSLHIRQAKKALDRFKEEKILNMIYRLGAQRPTHDNLNPLNSAFGTTRGRSLDGSQNGTVVAEDIFEMYQHLYQAGFKPDIILAHPLTWLMFINDPHLRHWAQMTNGPWFGSQWTGEIGRNDFPSLANGMSVTGASARAHGSQVGGDVDGNPLSSTFSQNLTSAPVIPGYLGMPPVRIIPTPFLPYSAADNTTTLIFADSNEFGFYIEDHPVQMDEWMDNPTDVFTIRLKERYTLREKNRGLGIAVAKNIVVASNEIILPAQAMIQAAGSFDVATRTVAVP